MGGGLATCIANTRPTPTENPKILAIYSKRLGRRILDQRLLSGGDFHGEQIPNRDNTFENWVAEDGQERSLESKEKQILKKNQKKSRTKSKTEMKIKSKKIPEIETYIKS